MDAPKVFVSHASEDKDRFVIDFATRLRAKAIDATVDIWEIFPGDSLVDKIFTEGIGKAEAVIIVLSQYSVNKPWVREEMNVSVVRRITEGIKLIPVIIDECKVPECLLAILWTRIKDTSNYGNELDRIVAAIYGHQEKPPLGTPPAYVQTPVARIPGVNQEDTLVLKLICEKAIEIGHGMIETESIVGQAEALGINQEQFSESLEVLKRKFYIRVVETLDGYVPNISVTITGFEHYARAYISDYSGVRKSVISQVVNLNINYSQAMAENLQQPLMVVVHILEKLGQERLVEVISTSSGVYVGQVSPELKRLLN